MKAAMDLGCLVTVGSPDAENEPGLERKGIVEKHTYAVISLHSIQPESGE
jgi:hypothetical protein